MKSSIKKSPREIILLTQNESIANWHNRLIKEDPYNCKEEFKNEYDDWQKDIERKNFSPESIVAQKIFIYRTIKKYFIELLKEHAGSFINAYFFNDEEFFHYWFILEMRNDYQIFQDMILGHLLNNRPDKSIYGSTDVFITFLNAEMSIKMLQKRKEFENLNIKSPY